MTGKVDEKVLMAVELVKGGMSQKKALDKVKAKYGVALGTDPQRLAFRELLGNVPRKSNAKPRSGESQKATRAPKASKPSRGGKAKPADAKMEQDVLVELFKDNIDGTSINDLYNRLSPKVGPGVSHNKVKNALDNLKRNKQVQKVGKNNWMPVAPPQVPTAISQIVGEAREPLLGGISAGERMARIMDNNSLSDMLLSKNISLGEVYDVKGEPIIPPIKSIEVTETKVTMAPEDRKALVARMTSRGSSVGEIDAALKANKFSHLGHSERKRVGK